LQDLIEAVKCFELIRQGRPASEFVIATARLRQRHTPQPGTQACAEDPVRCLPISECVSRLKASKILALRDQNSGPATEIMGIPIVYVPFAELNDLAQAANPEEVREWADRWQKGAQRIEGVTRETIEKSAAMYLGQKALMKKHTANAITINCLGGFYGNHISAYPCLGFCQLVDDGLVGACECDVRSAAAMVAITTLTQGRPGYMPDAKRTTNMLSCFCVFAFFGGRDSGRQAQGLAGALELGPQREIVLVEGCQLGGRRRELLVCQSGQNRFDDLVAQDHIGAQHP
jgi:L-fucose isomerase-like protein